MYVDQLQYDVDPDAIPLKIRAILLIETRLAIRFPKTQDSIR